VYNQSETCEVDDTLRLSQVRQIAQDTSDLVIIGLPFVNHLRSDRQSHCFVVNATNGTYTAMIRGTFNTGNNKLINYELVKLIKLILLLPVYSPKLY
jgi:hypothetical protein